MNRLRHVAWSVAALLAAAPALCAGAPPKSMSDAIVQHTLDNLVVLEDSHWHWGEYNHIVNLCRVQVEGDPANIEAYSDAGWLLESLGRNPEAADLYTLGARNNPKTYRLHWELGYHYGIFLKDWGRALPHLERAAAQADCPPISLHQLAHALERAGRLQDCLSIWKKAADNPRNEARATAAVQRDRVQRLINR